MTPFINPGFYLWAGRERNWPSRVGFGHGRSGRAAAGSGPDTVLGRWLLVVGWRPVEAGILPGPVVALERPGVGAGPPCLDHPVVRRRRRGRDRDHGRDLCRHSRPGFDRGHRDPAD